MLFRSRDVADARHRREPLGDERVGETGAQLVPEELGAKMPGALPEAVGDRQKRQLAKLIADFVLELGIGEELAEHHGRERRQALREAFLDEIDVAPLAPGQVRDERAGVDGDQERSSRSSSSLTEIFTFPRRRRSRS